jgi:predicted molibdopterin-dependent oxidoreductase YjgC
MWRTLDASWKYQHPSEVMDEIASLTPMFAGVNHRRLEGYKSLRWPVTVDRSGSAVVRGGRLLEESIRFPCYQQLARQVQFLGLNSDSFKG